MKILPAIPSLRAFMADERAQRPTPAEVAISTAVADWLNPTFLDQADEPALRGRLLGFYECLADVPFHCDTLGRRVRLLRHGLNHLVRGQDPLAVKVERCAQPGAAYHVPGLGLSFWTALAQALQGTFPRWSPAIVHGLQRLGMLKRSDRRKPAVLLTNMHTAYETLRQIDPRVTAARLDRFLAHVAGMRGRDLPANARTMADDVADLVRLCRTKLPLRERLKTHLPVLQNSQATLAHALATGHAETLRQALRTLGRGDETMHDDALIEWTQRIWQAEEPLDALNDYWRNASLLGGGPWLPAAILHLKDPRTYPLWNDDARQGLARLDDGYDPHAAPLHAYPLFVEGCDELRRRFRLHPLEVPDVLQAANIPPDDTQRTDTPFEGFCSDTFRFLRELHTNNEREWMEQHRERYQYAVREPLAELCEALAARYVEPVLNQLCGWNLETAAKQGKALTSIARNDHGRTVPYETTLWITFYRRPQGGKRDDVQLFVRVDAHGIACGLSLGRLARTAGRTFRRNVQQYADELFRALAQTDALKRCQFLDDHGATLPIESPADLRHWATCKTLLAQSTFAADALVTRRDELVGEIMLTFDRLLPAYRCAIEDDPRPGLVPARPLFGPTEFQQQTFLGPAWLQTATSLLGLKRQLILQGVPGTGKTHVAKLLAKLLTSGRDDRVRLVQFHPAYTYEEFVEGIKARTVEVNGRHEVTYPVEDGVLCQFAAKAASRPSETFVLVIDEINRGNLPRIFGELLYLLEYREQEVVLPYSRRAFRLPANLFILGTMNAVDRSITPIDHALKRRFSFLEMPPNADLLRAWFVAQPPAEPALANDVVRLFETLNEKLAADLGPHARIGHSYFMVPHLNEVTLKVIWEHHVQPLLHEHFTQQPQRRSAYSLEALFTKPRNRPPAKPMGNAEGD